jgi:hypothetical protein
MLTKMLYGATHPALCIPLVVRAEIDLKTHCSSLYCPKYQYLLGGFDPVFLAQMTRIRPMFRMFSVKFAATHRGGFSDPGESRGGTTK